ncbi:HAD family hydrolase [Mesoflavibacter profundi]|uniref:HAD family hydrolase n=1 Tax=Mesoflavibacter profundi TaxID=2708110 RepID=UPI00168BEBA7|nr:HAD-IA family hydrolase [Mesoflavibacter profundi]
MKYILFDVAGTLLHKPEVYDKILEVLFKNNYKVDLQILKKHHKLLSEVIKFPDRTDKTFYQNFNSELLYSLGIIPNQDILEQIFKACSYLPWQAFNDCSVLQELNIPIGIISNFNSSLEDVLKDKIDVSFSNIFVSEKIGYSKPDIRLYKLALDKLNILPEDVLYIGDSFKLDYQPASQLGIKTLIIDRDNFYPNHSNIISSLEQIKSYI